VDQSLPPSGTGALDSLRALGSTVVELIGTRAQLLALELREEGERRKQMLALALAAGLFLALGLLLVAFLVVVLFWDTHRLAAIGAVTVLYLGIGAWAFARLNEKARASPPPFQATLAEFASDLEMLRGQRRDE
jgi:uncharacterized membrane protein YqjE